MPCTKPKAHNKNVQPCDESLLLLLMLLLLLGVSPTFAQPTNGNNGSQGNGNVTPATNTNQRAAKTSPEEPNIMFCSTGYGKAFTWGRQERDIDWAGINGGGAMQNQVEPTRDVKLSEIAGLAPGDGMYSLKDFYQGQKGIPLSAITLKKLPENIIQTMKHNWHETTGERLTGPGFEKSLLISMALYSALQNSPESQMQAAAATGQAQAVEAGDAGADVARDQSACAIGFCASYLENFTTQQTWNKVRDQIFVPMAILLLLPGAVLAQAHAIAAAGNPVLKEVSPFDGITRSIIAIFMIPATALVVNYGIDVNNSIAYTISSEYKRIFGSDMYQDALSHEIRATPVRQPQTNRNALDLKPWQPTPLINPSSTSSFAYLERLISPNVTDPVENVDVTPPERADEAMSAGVAASRLMMMGTNASLAAAWNILCALQLAYLYYLWCVGPIMAAIWVYPLPTLRNALPSWIEGVVTVCFWSLFWNTVILLMACFRGVDETGTMIMTALNFLATASVKFAFDFAGLVKAAGQEAAGIAAGAAQQAAHGAGANPGRGAHSGNHGGERSRSGRGGHGGSGGGETGGGAARVAAGLFDADDQSGQDANGRAYAGQEHGGLGGANGHRLGFDEKVSLAGHHALPLGLALLLPPKGDGALDPLGLGVLTKGPPLAHSGEQHAEHNHDLNAWLDSHGVPFGSYDATGDLYDTATLVLTDGALTVEPVNISFGDDDNTSGLQGEDGEGAAAAAAAAEAAGADAAANVYAVAAIDGASAVDATAAIDLAASNSAIADAALAQEKLNHLALAAHHFNLGQHLLNLPESLHHQGIPLPPGEPSGKYDVEVPASPPPLVGDGSQTVDNDVNISQGGDFTDVDSLFVQDSSFIDAGDLVSVSSLSFGDSVSAANLSGSGTSSIFDFSPFVSGLPGNNVGLGVDLLNNMNQLTSNNMTDFGPPHGVSAPIDANVNQITYHPPIDNSSVVSNNNVANSSGTDVPVTPIVASGNDTSGTAVGNKIDQTDGSMPAVAIFGTQANESPIESPLPNTNPLANAASDQGQSISQTSLDPQITYAPQPLTTDGASIGANPWTQSGSNDFNTTAASGQQLQLDDDGYYPSYLTAVGAMQIAADAASIAAAGTGSAGVPNDSSQLTSPNLTFESNQLGFQASTPPSGGDGFPSSGGGNFMSDSSNYSAVSLNSTEALANCEMPNITNNIDYARVDQPGGEVVGGFNFAMPADTGSLAITAPGNFDTTAVQTSANSCSPAAGDSTTGTANALPLSSTYSNSAEQARLSTYSTAASGALADANWTSDFSVAPTTYQPQEVNVQNNFDASQYSAQPESQYSAQPESQYCVTDAWFAPPAADQPSVASGGGIPSNQLDQQTHIGAASDPTIDDFVMPVVARNPNVVVSAQSAPPPVPKSAYEPPKPQSMDPPPMIGKYRSNSAPNRIMAVLRQAVENKVPVNPPPVSGSSRQANSENSQRTIASSGSVKRPVSGGAGSMPAEYARATASDRGDEPSVTYESMPSLQDELVLRNQRGGRLSKSDADEESAIKDRLDQIRST